MGLSRSILLILLSVMEPIAAEVTQAAAGTSAGGERHSAASVSKRPVAENVELDKPIKEEDILAPVVKNLPPSGGRARAETLAAPTGEKPPMEITGEVEQASPQDTAIEESDQHANELEALATHADNNNSDANTPALETVNNSADAPIHTLETGNDTADASFDAGDNDYGDASAMPTPTIGKASPVSVKAKELEAEPGFADTAAELSELAEYADSDATSEAAEEPPRKPFVLLGTEVPPATSTRLAWAPSQSFEGIYSSTPVLVVNGADPGPILCLTAALHGDELNGIETVRRVLYNLDAQKLKGTVVGVPIVNLQGFRRGSRYLIDRRDLNRFFPGDPNGSSASRIAYSFFHEIIKHCSAIVDLHTGSFYRTNLPQLRGDLTNPKVVKMTEGFGSTVVLHSEGTVGTLRRAAVAVGIPAVTLEAGAPMVLSEEDVSHCVKAIRTLLNQLDMVSKFSLWGEKEPVYYNSSWQRAPEGGIIFSKVGLGTQVRVGDLLGTVTNPITNVRTEIRSAYNGRVLGMAFNQVVQPGFAAYHIGIEAPETQISEPEEVTATPEPAPVDKQLSKLEVKAEEEEEGETSLGPMEQHVDSE